MCGATLFGLTGIKERSEARIRMRECDKGVQLRITHGMVAKIMSSTPARNISTQNITIFTKSTWRIISIFSIFPQLNKPLTFLRNRFRKSNTSKLSSCLTFALLSRNLVQSRWIYYVVYRIPFSNIHGFLSYSKRYGITNLKHVLFHSKTS